MRCSDVIKIIEKEYPAEAAEQWDNPGLIAGRRDAEVLRVLVALDASDEVVEEAVRQGVQLLVTHHPLIFGSIKKVNDGDFLGRRLLTLIENRISLFAVHTNYDVCGMARVNAAALDLQAAEPLLESDFGENEGIGRVGDLKEPMSYREFGEYVKKTMGIADIRCYGLDDSVFTRAAVSSGAGRSAVGAAIAKNAQVLVTGDIDYHTGIDAAAAGLKIIDAGHFGTEYCFISEFAGFLRKACPGVEVIEAAQKPPYVMM